MYNELRLLSCTYISKFSLTSFSFASVLVQKLAHVTETLVKEIIEGLREILHQGMACALDFSLLTYMYMLYNYISDQFFSDKCIFQGKLASVHCKYSFTVYIHVHVC